jgi:hypothetical protein
MTLTWWREASMLCSYIGNQLVDQVLESVSVNG